MKQTQCDHEMVVRFHSLDMTKEYKQCRVCGEYDQVANGYCYETMDTFDTKILYSKLGEVRSQIKNDRDWAQEGATQNGEFQQLFFRIYKVVEGKKELYQEGKIGPNPRLARS